MWHKRSLAPKINREILVTIKTKTMTNCAGKRTKWVRFRLTPDEHREIHELSQRAGFKSKSTYGRIMLLAQPKRAGHYNASKADLLVISLELEQDLRKIADCFRQTIEFLSLHPELALWVQIHKQDEAHFKRMAEKVSIELKELNRL